MESAGYFFTSSVIMHHGTNNMDQNQPKDIAGGNFPKSLRRNILNKNHHYWHVTNIHKMDSFRGTKSDKQNTMIGKSILKAECKNFPQTHFMNQEDEWAKNDIVLNENIYYKDFLYLMESGTKKLFKSICLYLKRFFTESRHPLS